MGSREEWSEEQKANAKARLREHFPEHHDETWKSRRRGYAHVPRLLSYCAALISRQRGGKAALPVYIALWMRDRHNVGLVELDSLEILGHEAGIWNDKRCRRDTRARLSWLADHGFIRTAPRGTVEHGLVLLRDPRLVLPELRQSQAIPREHWHNIDFRASKVGVKWRDPPAADDTTVEPAHEDGEE